MAAYKKIPEYHQLSADHFFKEIALEQKPIVIRGFAKHWPLVTAAQQEPHDFANYLMRFYNGKKARVLVAPPGANKRFYYNDDMTDVNYIRGEERVDLFLMRMLELMDREVCPAISIQNVSPSDFFPGLVKENKSDFFLDDEPHLWMGNEGIVSAHYDGSDNIACVVAGRRRFILFSPEQIGNLYPGSLNFTPAGAPTSMVNLNHPDFEQFPLFKVALENAYSVELYPGDAIFIPMLWWHHVESLEKVNALMNYWWNGSAAKDAVSPSPIDSLNIALLAMRDLTPKQRNAWRSMFDHYLFKQGVDPASYIPEHQLHVLGKLSAEYIRSIKDYFIEKLKK